MKGCQESRTKPGFSQIKKDSSHALLYYIFFIQYNLNAVSLFFFMEISCAQPYGVTFIKILAFRSKHPK